MGYKMSDLIKIAEQVNLILLAEIGALIHDIGKLSRDFVIHQSHECSPGGLSFPECSFDHMRILGTTFLNPTLNTCLQDSKKWRPLLKSDTVQQLKQTPEHLGHFISGHNKKDSGMGLLALITRCDQVDSGVDKGALRKDTGKQSWDATYKASAFGYEQKIPIGSDKDGLKPLMVNLSQSLETSLKSILEKSPATVVQERNSILRATESAFREALGETRRAANDVTLWDHSYSVASLQKAVLAQVFILNKWPTDLSNLQWRILRIAFDGLQFLENASRITDLFGKLEIIREALRNVRTLLEITLPIGNEIYSDENGSAFLVPDVENLLELEDNQGNALRECIKKKFGEELYGEISIDLTPNWVSGPSKYGIELGKLLSRPSPPLIPDAEQVRNQWDTNCKVDICAVCGMRPMGYPVQGSLLHQQIEQALAKWATQDKAQNRNICRICLDRRGRRVQKWIERSMKGTIWTDEVADSNGRVAFIVGFFDLDDWLDGRLLSTVLGQEFPKDKRYMDIVAQLGKDLKEKARPDGNNPPLIQQMAPEAFRGNQDAESFYQAFVKERDIHGLAGRIAEDDFNARAALLLRFLLRKNPSFARLRRIWETTRGFWQDVCPTDETQDLQKSHLGNIVGLAGPRLEIRGKLRQKGGSENPGPYHAYDLVLTKGIKLSVVWDPEEGKSEGPKGRLISIDNLVYLASLANAKPPSIEEDEIEKDYRLRLHEWAAEKIRELIQEKEGSILPIEEPTGYGGRAKEWGEITVESVEIIPDSKYTPAIPILAEPRTFMALVPADKALEVVGTINAKYEREMGKVRNRLPLHLGIVYAHRRMPLRAILDAGRRMLDLDGDHSSKPDGWKVVCASRKLVKKDDPLPERLDMDKEGQFSEWLDILLEKDGRRLTWHVPAMMGDGTTEDVWYPFVFLDSSSEPIDRDRRLEAPNPWTGSDGWLVHASDLKLDDVVYFTPATLDFQWLDSAGKRFEIAYDGKGQRLDLPRRPYLLDELEALEEIWKTLKGHLTKNQIYILRDLIETKRVDWRIEKDKSPSYGTFKQFCRDALANAEWKKLPWQTGGQDHERWLDQWAIYAVRGWIADVIELHLQIMKEEVEG